MPSWLAPLLVLVLSSPLAIAKKKDLVQYADVPYIECDVCKEAVRAAYVAANAMRQKLGKVPPSVCPPTGHVRCSADCALEASAWPL